MFVLFYVHVRSLFNRLIIRFAVLCPPQPLSQRMTSFQIAFLTDVVPVRLNGSNAEVNTVSEIAVYNHRNCQPKARID